MASSSGPLNEELLCSICLDVFTDPVTIPCGHNFCRTCLNKCWTNTQTCFCPVCKQKFSKRPDLEINTTITKEGQHFKKLNKEKSETLISRDFFLTLYQTFNNSKGMIVGLSVLLVVVLFTSDDSTITRMFSSLYSLSHSKKWTEISDDSNVDLYSMKTSLTLMKKRINEELSQIELKWAQSNTVDVTLDPDTANPYFILSDDGKQVSCGDIKQNVPENPKRFDDYCVLGKQGFSSGRFYFEVQVKGKTRWCLGVARESVNRKGDIRLSPKEGLWTLKKDNEFIVYDNPSVSLSLRVNPETVGVFVDYEEGLVSFYDVGSRSHIYSFTAQTFTEKLYPLFGPGHTDKGKNSKPLIITSVKSPET